MYDLQKVAKDCMSLLDSLNIQYGNVLAFEINTRAKSRYGQCEKVGKNQFKININADLLDERNPISALQNTLIHELLHTCKNCMSHTGEWLRLANIVNANTNFTIKRESTKEEKGIVFLTTKKIEYKYVIQCEKCGAKWYRSRNTDFVKHPNLYTCGCGGQLKRIK